MNDTILKCFLHHGSCLGLGTIHHCAFSSDCDCDSSYRNKWVVQDSMEVFTLCDCDKITNSYVAHYEQKKNRSRNQKKIAQCEQALTFTDITEISTTIETC